MRWTQEQENAIQAHGGTVLVSAAAGSGKTAVLVERVIRMVCDTQNPCPLNKLLIVTFTKAAAAEMRERIGLALEACLKNDPQNRYLLKQQLLLPTAQICTIDSFCGTLVKAHYNELNISPDFRLLDDSERKSMEEEAVSESILPLYSEKSEAFLNLSDIFLLGGSDRMLKDTILDLYHYAQAYPFPNIWLQNIPALYSSEKEVFSTPWGQKILAYIKDIAKDNIEILHTAFSVLADDIPLLDAYAPALNSDLYTNEKLLDLCEARDWDALKEELESYKPERLKAAPKEYKESLVKATATSLRDSVKKAMKGLVGILPVTCDEYREDAQILQPIISLLIDTVERFSDILYHKKQEANAYDFNDISHMALQLCVTEDAEGNLVRTELAKTLAQEYREILLDEYQDTNKAQDLLFSAISDDEKNLFMVGDVKQSIYAFRRAMPDIFIERRDHAAVYDGETFPARIDLNANFRSRKTVAEGINAVFSRIMSREMGGVEYGDTEKLNPCGDFAGTEDLAVELHLLESNDANEDGSLPEAVHIAKTIRQMVDSKMPVFQKDKTQRPVQYGDICILMRSTTGAEKYKEALENEGIPTFFQKKGGFFSMREVSLVVSLLQILDNPFLDVPLCACLLSPLWGFTPDDISNLKLDYKEDSFFSRLSRSDEAKAKAFLEDYAYLRRLSTTLTPASLLRAIYEKTGCMAIVGALPGGENRRLNLLLLLQYAEEYEAKGKTGLAGFLRYLERLKENESNVEAATGVSSYANVVRIMTIHKSKGLEFPVVILAKCGSSFNTQDQKKKMLLHNDMKIGMKVPDRKNHRVFSSVPYVAGKLAIAEDERAEELRVLYVALTRAKEKLILVGSGGKKRSIQNVIKNAALAVLNKDTVPLFFVRKAGSYLDLLVAALLKHPDADALLALADVPPVQKSKEHFPLKIVLDTLEAQAREKDEPEEAPATVNAELLSKIRAKTSYVYPRAALSKCPAKASASALNEKHKPVDFFATARPAFMSKEGLTPAMRGAATHRFAEKCDFKNAKEDLEKEIQRLEKEGFLSQEETEALDRIGLFAFFSSPLFARMEKSPRIYREQKFTVFFSAGDVDSALPDALKAEEVLIQGVLDCAFEENGKIVIVDYKTDHEKDEEKLRETYKEQLSVYKRAAKEVFGKEISETLLYSFYLKKEISINL